MIVKITLFLLVLFSAKIALSQSFTGDLNSSIEDEFAFLSRTHLPIEFGLNGEIHYKLPFISNDDHENRSYGIELFLRPIAIFGFDKVDRVISLDRSNSYGLVKSQQDDKFLHIKSFKWDLGLGAELASYIGIPFAIGVGPSYFKGKNYYREMVLNHRTENRNKLEIPKTKQEFDAWRIGDRITFGTRSSFIFGVSFRLSPVRAEVLASSTGQYIIKYQKVSESNLEVNIINQKTKATSIEGRAVVVAGKLEKYSAKGNGFTFSYNMNSAKGIEAFNQALIGNLTLSQQLALEYPKAVQELSNYNSVSSGNTRSGRFFIPTLYTYQRSKNNDYAVINKQLISNDKKEKITMSSITKEKRTRGALSKHMVNSETIRVITVEDTDNTKQSVLASNVYWGFEKDKTSVSEIKGFLNRIADRTGLSRMRDVKIPGNKLAFTRVQVAVNFSAEDVFVLFNDVSLKIIKANAIAKLIRDFTTFGHRKFCKLKKETKCFKLYRNFILSAVKSIIFNRDLANVSFKNGNKKLALNKINYILKSLVDSNYLLKAFVAQAPNLDIEFSIEGENIKRSTINL
jgi:hypothetical protein